MAVCAERIVESTEGQGFSNWSGNTKTPPDSKKFQIELNAINAEIQQKESELTAVSANRRAPEQNSGGNNLRSVQGDKSSAIAKRSQINAALTELNQAMAKKNDELTKQKATLTYRDAGKIDATLQKLEDQLRRHNFKNREEARIVQEIDKLKRSRKKIEQIRALQNEVNAMKDRQRKMRLERDSYHREISDLKSTEENLKKKNSENWKKKETLQSELTVLYEQRTQLVKEHKHWEDEIFRKKEQQRRLKFRQYRQKREEEKLARQERHQRELEEYEASREPYEDERQLCVTLLSYLQYEAQRSGATRDGVTHGASLDVATLDGASSVGATQDGVTLDATSPTEPDGGDMAGMVLLRRSTEELVTGVAKSKKRKEKRRGQGGNKLLPKNLQVLNQFDQLGLRPPIYYSDLPESIKHVSDKKAHFDELAEEKIRFRLGGQIPPVQPRAKTGSDVAKSESWFRTTPEVQADFRNNMAEDFPTLSQAQRSPLWSGRKTGSGDYETGSELSRGTSGGFETGSGLERVHYDTGNELSRGESGLETGSGLRSGVPKEDNNGSLTMDSIPTTPEVLLDGVVAPLEMNSKRLSPDSGTCELETNAEIDHPTANDNINFTPLEAALPEVCNGDMPTSGHVDSPSLDVDINLEVVNSANGVNAIVNEEIVNKELESDGNTLLTVDKDEAANADMASIDVNSPLP